MDAPDAERINRPKAKPIYLAPKAKRKLKTEIDRSVYYQNCSAARAAGAAPVMAGDPGYARKLDRDGDGVGCE